jgi:hypothetical protein
MGQKVWNGFGANHVNKESRERIPASADKTIQVLGLKDWCMDFDAQLQSRTALRARVGLINTREKLAEAVIRVMPEFDSSLRQPEHPPLASP